MSDQIPANIICAEIIRTGIARRKLKAQSSLAQAPGSEDDAMGMTWWNVMTQPERREVLRQGGAMIRGISVAQAWRLWKAGRISMTPPNEQAHT